MQKKTGKEKEKKKEREKLFYTFSKREQKL